MGIKKYGMGFVIFVCVCLHAREATEAMRDMGPEWLTRVRERMRNEG